MTPIDASPDQWHAHPGTLGYGLVADVVVLVVALVVGLALTWWYGRAPRRRRHLSR